MLLQNVCVIGGSGFLGRHVVHRLAAREIFVRVPTRRRERSKELILLPTVDVINADVHDPKTLERLVAPADAVINLVGILHETRGETFERNHVELPRKIVDACRATGVKRLVHVSALKAAFDAPSAYLRSKAEGESQIHAAQAIGIRTTILRPSVIFGRDDSFLNLFARLARLLPIIALASPQARFQPVFVEDVARALSGCLTDSHAFGRTYDLCGPKAYTLRQLVEYVCRTLGVQRRIIGLNEPLSLLQAALLERLPGRLMTRDNVYSMRADSVCDCAFPELFGISPMPVEAVVPQYLAGVTPRTRYRWFRYRARR
ncbi:MAG TPA: complex I NDUFA9 subunit family protein [Burkholderiales bacterium]|nr:complex I NDUFA9 subunit family protein [Burkholderiales bacterium]